MSDVVGSGSAGAPRSGGVAVPALAYRDVSFSYPGPAVDGSTGPRAALERVTLEVAEGTRLGILGPNGGGKSTMLKLTLGLLRGNTGEIRVFGHDPDEARKLGLIGYVPQRIEAEMAFPVSVREAVAMAAVRGLSPWRRVPESAMRAVDESLSLVGAADLATRPIGRLSGGQLQRVMIARALAARPRLLLLDEPMVGIDVSGQQRFADLLGTLHRTLGLTIVVVSHDIRTIAAGSDKVACLARTLHSHVTPQGLTPQVLAEVFSHDVAAIFGDVHIDAHLAHECGHDHAHEHHDHGPTSSVRKAAPGLPSEGGTR